MTGQVKEDVLSRFGELGVYIQDGKLYFNPRLLKRDEFLEEAKKFRYVDVRKKAREIQVDKDCLGFTYCQVPVIYRLAPNRGVKVEFDRGPALEFTDLHLDLSTSKKVFERTGEINKITVSVNKWA